MSKLIAQGALIYRLCGRVHEMWVRVEVKVESEFVLEGMQIFQCMYLKFYSTLVIYLFLTKISNPP